MKHRLDGTDKKLELKVKHKMKKNPDEKPQRKRRSKQISVLASALALGVGGAGLYALKNRNPGQKTTKDTQKQVERVLSKEKPDTDKRDSGQKRPNAYYQQLIKQTVENTLRAINYEESSSEELIGYIRNGDREAAKILKERINLIMLKNLPDFSDPATVAVGDVEKWEHEAKKVTDRILAQFHMDLTEWESIVNALNLNKGFGSTMSEDEKTEFQIDVDYIGLLNTLYGQAETEDPFNPTFLQLIRRNELELQDLAREVIAANEVNLSDNPFGRKYSDIENERKIRKIIELYRL